MESAEMNNESAILFEDDMMENWQENWFLDGELATVEHRADGLFFSGGTVTKSEDRQAYHAHHAVLWTKQVFQGDIRIRYEMTRVDTSDYGNTLLYIQAEGLGTEGYPEDITKWNEKRAVPAMEKYFVNMNLISLSFRHNLRCKRYPYRDADGNWFSGRGLIRPMVDYIGMIPGKQYLVEVEKRAGSTRLILTDAETKEVYLDHTWDTTDMAAAIERPLVDRGRIGLRHMSTKQFTYRNFVVERL